MDPTQVIRQQYLDQYRQSELPGMPNYSTQWGHRVQNPEAAMMAQRYGAGQMGYQGFMANGTPAGGPQEDRNNPAISRFTGNVKPNLTGGMDYGSAMSRPNIGRQAGQASTYGVPGSTGDAVSGMSMSKLGGMAKNFGRSIMPGSGRNVAQAFGKQSLGKPGGLLSKAGALPGWSMPAAAAIGFQINKRLGQKAHQKDLARYQDQIRNTPTDQQHTLGPAPTHNRRAGFLGRMFKR